MSAHDKQFREWAVQTVVEEGVATSPQLRECAEHVEQFLGAQLADVKGSRGRVGRLDETNGATASDGPTLENNSEVECNLNTLEEAESCCGRARSNSSWAKSGGSRPNKLDIPLGRRSGTWDRASFFVRLEGGRCVFLERRVVTC